MLKTKKAIKFDGLNLEASFPTKGRWDFRNGVVHIEPSFGEITEEGICLGELHNSEGDKEFIEYPGCPTPFAFVNNDRSLRRGLKPIGDEGDAEELDSAYHDLERALHRLMEIGMKRVHRREDIKNQTFRIGRERHNLDFDCIEHDVVKHRPYVKIIESPTNEIVGSGLSGGNLAEIAVVDANRNPEAKLKGS